MKLTNISLNNAKIYKNDEFYTQFTDIEKELQYYLPHLKGNVIYCNCDNPEQSNFWKYFHINFKKLKLKKLISTYYDKEKTVYKTVYDGKEDIKTPLQGNGDFRSQECRTILAEANIIITNPPFSLFRKYIRQLIDLDKQFLVVGSKNSIPYKDFFPLLKENKVWVGVNNIQKFLQLDGSFKTFGNIGWFTNLDISKRHKQLINKLSKKYSPEEYPKFDNFDAINVNKVLDIPIDYYGIMGVPITFFDKYNPNEFEIIWQASGNTKACCPNNILYDVLGYSPHPKDRGGCGVVNNVRKYSRIFIKRITVII